MPCAVAGGRLAQLRPAGDQDQRVAARDQAAHLVAVPDVVEQEQYFPARQFAAQEHGAGIGAGGDPLRRDVQRPQHRFEGVGGAHRVPWTVAAQVDEQLPAGKTILHAVRPVHCHRRLGRGPDLAEQLPARA
ncbi:hypothetical protein [Streptomyces sparsogenes]|uniref:hypothetical protein n=1 Tax=Streptomyces sparsogenes TaxID=67365 RepID=UPI00114C897C|nr:hypothetical protein [Streptomyces sparsogenes]